MIATTEPLNELDFNEWWDVYRVFKPDATREEYEAAWISFQHAKADHIKSKEAN